MISTPTTFELTPQELSVLISAMNYMTKEQELVTGDMQTLNRLYNKLYTRHEYLINLQKSYECNV